jgi:hypothetical protein
MLSDVSLADPEGLRAVDGGRWPVRSHDLANMRTSPARLNSLGAQIETFRDIWDSAFHLSSRLGVDDYQRV